MWTLVFLDIFVNLSYLKTIIFQTEMFLKVFQLNKIHSTNQM
jgi:hypothetical protein